MAKKKFSIGNLNALDDGKVQLALDRELIKIANDMSQRPGDKTARKLKLEISFVPQKNDLGNCDAASMEFDRCGERSAWIRGWMRSLCDRLRPVRVCCGHWSRVCDSPSTMTRLGTTGVFLDPPYRTHLKCGKKNRTAHIYASDKVQDIGVLCDEVQAWCLRWGADRDVRIALCGLDGEYPEIEASGWDCEAWKSNGGYGNQSGAVNENAARERVWYSPHCVSAGAAGGGLFA